MGVGDYSLSCFKQRCNEAIDREGQDGLFLTSHGGMNDDQGLVGLSSL